MKSIFVGVILILLSVSGCTTTEITALNVSSAANTNTRLECVNYDDFYESANGIKENLKKGWNPMVTGKALTCFFWCTETITVCYEKTP